MSHGMGNEATPQSGGMERDTSRQQESKQTVAGRVFSLSIFWALCRHFTSLMSLML